jgi:hypothetical protein
MDEANVAHAMADVDSSIMMNSEALLGVYRRYKATSFEKLLHCKYFTSPILWPRCL